MTVCDDCGGPVSRPHYTWCRGCFLKNHNPMKTTPPEIRFRRYYAESEGCWEWQSTRSPDGYGKFLVVNGKSPVNAHRYAYELAHGPIADGLTIDHLCRNRLCVNPEHLEAVTNRENVLRGVGPTAVNARKTHCIQGHEFTPENTYYDRGVDVAGCCPACGSNTLFVAARGHVTCSLLDCPDPGAADELLSSGKRVRALCELAEHARIVNGYIEHGIKTAYDRVNFYHACCALVGDIAALASLEPARGEET